MGSAGEIFFEFAVPRKSGHHVLIGGVGCTAFGEIELPFGEQITTDMLAIFLRVVEDTASPDHAYSVIRSAEFGKITLTVGCSAGYGLTALPPRPRRLESVLRLRLSHRLVSGYCYHFFLF